MINASIPGRLGNDAELRQTQRGTPVLNFRLATESGIGENRSTYWVDCALFGRRAEALAPHLTKGSAVTAFGELTQRRFERRDGTEGYALGLRIADLELQGGKTVPSTTPPPEPEDVPF